MKYLKLFLFLITNSLHSIPPLQEVYAFWNFYENNYHQCPLQGIAAVESSWIKNLLLTGDENHKTIKFGKKILHILEISEELSATTYDPFSKFNFKSIATLIHALEINKIHEESNDQLLKKLKESFTGAKKTKSLNELIYLINEVQKEELSGLYPKNTIQQVLLSFLYLKVNKTRELRNFTANLRSKRNDKRIINASCTKAWTKEEFNNFTNWCQALQEEKFTNIPEEFQNPEFLLAALSHEHQAYDQIPPKIYYETHKRNDIAIADCCEATLEYFCSLIFYNPKTKLIDFSYFNPKGIEKIPEPLKNFIQNIDVQNVKTINDSNQRSIWYQLISNINAIEYRRTTEDNHTFEIHPSASNLIGALQYIFGLSINKIKITKENATQQWQKICKELSHESTLQISCLKTWFGSNTTNSATFQLIKDENLDKNPLIFTLHIQPEHSWITIDNAPDFKLFNIVDGQRKKTNRAQLIEYLRKKYIEDPTGIFKDLLRLCAPYIKIEELPKEEATYNLALLCHPTENDLQKMRHCTRLLYAIKDINSKYLPILFKQANLFYEKFYLRTILCSIINKNLLNSELALNAISELSEKLPKKERYQSLLALVNKKAWQYNGYEKLIEKLFYHIPDYEDDWHKQYDFIMDTKIAVLHQILLWHGHHNETIKNKILENMTSLPKERALKLYRLCKVGPFSKYEDKGSLQMRVALKL